MLKCDIIELQQDFKNFFTNFSRSGSDLDKSSGSDLIRIHNFAEKSVARIQKKNENLYYGMAEKLLPQ
jgi:hypothetical protein